MPNLAGLHDIEATAIAAPDTWIVDTIALSENPTPKTYPANLNIITRINWGYGSTGTLPLPSVYEPFSQMAANYVAGAHNCHRWQIGNESNLKREWPDHQPIFPWHYADCYTLCRDAIRALPGHARDEVLVAGSGPWNDECKYEGNPNGDWVQYFADCVRLCGVVDGFALHSYTHHYDVELVSSSARMDAPFHNRYFEFYTYRDYCAAIPQALRHLPAYITEANGDGPWQAVGLMPAMLQEIDSWNLAGNSPAIHCVTFYRYPRYDHFYIEGRDDVIAEYRQAVARDYQSPPVDPRPQPPRPTPPDPTPPVTPPTPVPDEIDWDERLTARGCTLQPALVPSDPAPLVRVGRWFSEEEAQGRVNVFVRLLDESGNLATDVPVTWFWADGSETKRTERKSDPWLQSKGLPAEYSLDFSMYTTAPAYGIRIEGYSGDVIDGCGLGSIEQPDWNIHTSYYFEWKLSQVPEIITPPIPPITPIPPTGAVEAGVVLAPAGLNMRTGPGTNFRVLGTLSFGSTVLHDDELDGWLHVTDGWVSEDYVGDALGTEVVLPPPTMPLLPGGLVHPLPGSVITQNFYQNPQAYERFQMPGHDGCDFGGMAQGTPILAMADGVVLRAAFDAPGYGNFVEVAHDHLGATTIYAHAERNEVSVGQVVTAGQTIALLGTTGNSTGVHLHLSVRLINKDGSYREDCPMRKGRCDPRTWAILHGLTL